MRYEVVEEDEAWIVRSEGCELARFERQTEALNDVAARLRDADTSEPSALTVHYLARSA